MMNVPERAECSWDITWLDSCDIAVPAGPPDEESLLLQLAVTGHAHALTLIHNKYHCAIYAYALCRVSDPMLAEDIASEVLTRFIEVLNRNDRLPKNLRGWLFGVAHKVVTDHYRRKSRRQVLSLDHIGLEDTDDLGDSPLDIFERNMRQVDLREAFGKLTQAQKDVLSLRFGAAMTLVECAELLNRSVGSVKVLQFRGLRRLRALLSAWEG